jgi:hypothetical protein
MARIRTVKPEIRKDRVVSSWPYEVRWTFVGLPGYCDDEGRGEDDPLLVKAELYPLDEGMTSRKVEKHLEQIATSGPLCRYKVAGQRFLHLVNFGRHQVVNRPKPSVIPPCPIHESAPPKPAPIHGVITESSVNEHGAISGASLPEGKGREGNREGSLEQTAPPPASLTDKRGSRLPDDWELPDDWRLWAVAEGATDQQALGWSKRFADYWRGRSGAGGRKADWLATWRNWVRSELEKNQPAEANPLWWRV